MNTTFASENTSFKRMVMINEMGKKMEQQAREAASKVLKQQENICHNLISHFLTLATFY
jgi:hypothetical protein